MHAKDFSPILWDFIDRSQGSNEKLRVILEKCSREDVLTFHNEFQRAMQNLGKVIYSAGVLFPGPDEQLSEDAKKDIMGYAVSQGSRYYDEVIDNPSIIRHDVGPDDVPLVGVAGMVFWDRFAEEITLQ